MEPEFYTTPEFLKPPESGEETFYNPGAKSYELLAGETLIDKFPELDKSGHYEFNNFLAQHPELQGRTDIYNVLGGMDVARRIQPGPKVLGYDWSDPYSLTALGGLYSLWDSHNMGPDQTYKEGLADAFRNIKGVGIQRDWNPLGLLYDDAEADYYTGYYDKIHKDYQKMQMDRWRQEKLTQLLDGPLLKGTFDFPIERGSPVKIPPMLPSGQDNWSPGGAERGEPTRQAAHASYDRPGAKGSPGYRWKNGGLATMFERR